MITIAEHSFEETLLPQTANVLDLGSRGFKFCNSFLLNGHRVISVDCDPLVRPDTPDHYQMAIDSYDGEIYMHKTGDPQGTFVTRYKVGEKVKCMTLDSFSKMVGVRFWDLVKMDIEGSEFPVIMNMGKAPAKQLSIEFHLHTGIYGDKEVKEMEDKLLSLGYFPVKHDKTSEHGAGFNYWDSLWILK